MAENLIVNDSFDQGAFAPWQGLGSVMVAPGWTPWWTPAVSGDPAWKLATPEFKEAKSPFDNRVHSGASAQQWFTADKTHSGGIFQRVAVPVGALLRLSVWAQVWSTKGNDPTSGSQENGRENGHLEVRLGLDLSGGTNPWAESVIWSDWAACYDFWRKLEMEWVAHAVYVTVFIQSECMYPVSHNDVYVDDVALEVVGGETPQPGEDDPVLVELRNIVSVLREIADKL